MASELWHPGKNQTVDALVFNGQQELLLIQRKDCGQWALPGGFVDQADEDFEAAARREVREETQLELGERGVLFYQGMVSDDRNTLERWIETAGFLYQAPDRPEVSGGDDAGAAKWHALDALPYPLYGSHLELLRLGLARLR